MAFKSSNDLRVEVRWQRGLLVPRAFRGDTEIQIREMTQGHDGLDFTADLGAEIVAAIAPLPADIAAQADLTPEEVTEAAIQAKKDAVKAESDVTVAQDLVSESGKAKSGGK